MSLAIMTAGFSRPNNARAGSELGNASVGAQAPRRIPGLDLLLLDFQMKEVRPWTLGAQQSHVTDQDRQGDSH
jgi:hypothetical protein